MIVVLVMDREQTYLLAVEFTPAVRTDPWKQLKCAFPKIVVALRLVAPCHASLRGERRLGARIFYRKSERNACYRRDMLPGTHSPFISGGFL